MSSYVNAAAAHSPHGGFGYNLNITYTASKIAEATL